MTEPATPAPDAGSVEAIEARLFGEPEAVPADTPETGEEQPQDSLDTQAELDLDQPEQELDAEGGDEQAEPEPSGETSLAEALGVLEGQVEYGGEDGNEILFNAKVNGEISQVSLKDLAASYQLQQHVNQKSEAVSRQQREFEEYATRQAQATEQKLGELEAVLETARQKLLGDVEGTDWDALKARDPAQWAIRRQEASETASRLEQVKQLIDTERQQGQQQQAQQQQVQFQQYLQEQRDKLLAANPAWVDDNVRESEMKAIRGFMAEQYGYGEQELNQVYDSRLVALMQDAYAYRNAKTVAAKKLDKPTPTFRKPGAQVARSDKAAKARRHKALREQARKGDLKAVDQLLMDRFS